jgi:hypothetical protein
MMSLFHSPDCDAVRCRFAELHPEGPRLWGRMDAAQMLAHCSKGLEAATTDRPVRQAFLGRLVTPLIRPLVLGDRPFRRNAPTSPLFVVSDPRDFHAEMRRLAHLIDRFVQRGPVQAARVPHVFFGRLTGDEWGRLMYKHLDHHLRQFGV